MERDGLVESLEEVTRHGIVPDSSLLAAAGWDMRLSVRPTAAEDIALAACWGRWTLAGRWEADDALDVLSSLL